MKRQLPAWAVLCIIALVAGLMLGATNELTKDEIVRQTELAADAARKDVLPGADSFEEQALPEDGVEVDNCYAGLSGGEIIGYTAQATVKGYGGSIEVITGMNAEGIVTGISVGGASFSETPGLGAKTKEAAFTEQFRNVAPPIVMNDTVDAVTAATMSSGAVISGVNKCVEFLQATYLVQKDGAGDGEAELPKGIEAFEKTDDGYIITTTEQGFGGPVKAIVSISADGVITGVELEAPAETAGIGEQIVSKAEFREQFIGLSGSVEGADTVTGATISSEAAFKAVQKALDFAAAQ